MEIDGGGSGGSGGAASGADVSASEAAAAAGRGAGGGAGGGPGGSEVEGKSTAEGEPKVKRKMKTAFQLETLEKTYAVETYPSEELRAELSVKLGLSDRQLQMWFCHRRLKDRKPPSEKRQKKEVSPAMVAGLSSGVGEQMVVADAGNEPGRVSGPSTLGHAETHQQHRVARRAGTALARIGTEQPSAKRYYEPPQAISELRAIAFVESQLGERLREDGPILGMEFDPLPPGAFGAPIVPSGQHKPGLRLYEAPVYERPDAKLVKGATRLVHEYQFLPEQPSIRDDIRERAAPSHFYSSSSDAPSSRTPLSSGRSFLLGGEQLTPGHSFQGQMPGLGLLPQLGKQSHQSSPASGEVEIVPRRSSFASIGVDAHNAHPIIGAENPFITPDRRVTHDVERLQRKRKSEEARIAREVEAHEKRIRKELEKQDLLRRKREEQMRKEIERQDKERRKEEERLLREKQREEERQQREQRREMERREKFLQKESLRAEKMRAKEEMRREKEAARLKAANERAAARRIAKESLELIDDERLELMELAASSHGFPSILALDNEALQNLELHRDKLTEFPPKSVHLKRPFGIQPWTESESSVGNLLMVWKFLMTFADVLGLWPFTLDEFVQALHDFDSRLLGEIHIALLRTIIKDIEDVARTPATALGANQNSGANPGGGHPQIVEGAYTWGFDIRNWQQHLNPLTWSEVLRQFALSAGLGPKLKKKNVEQASLADENEGNGSANIISDLRNGVAAENALAKMRRRGMSNLRRSRHRLTPGTVKYAAFHVLSLEGSHGLSILEVAEKIQKSGLRDLTTSKTPEASIAAALSRDTKLFERTAPSTYCVRSPYRKDPLDTDSILSAARERIQVFRNGCLDAEEAEEAEKEDVERDEDSESDVAEDPDIDDLDNDLKPNKEALVSLEARQYDGETCSGNGKENSHSELMEIQQSGSGNTERGLHISKPKTCGEQKNAGTSVDCSTDAFGVHTDTINTHQEDNVLDESTYGELWVQGLTEGDYSNLSVEERLDALVALIGVANEGNSVRIILEERLEAATALKKQMWSEAQLDKRRIKEEYAIKMLPSSVSVNRAELNFSGNVSYGTRSPFVATDGINEVVPANPQNQQEDMGNTGAERNMQLQDLSGHESLLLQQTVYAAEKSRSEIKAYIGHKAEEIYVFKSLPLGHDRRRNRYWQFVTSPSQNDPGCGRIFIELHDGRWRVIDSVQDFDALLESLDVRGIREFHLQAMLRRIELSFKEFSSKKLSNSGSQDGENEKREVLDSPRRKGLVSNTPIREPLVSCVNLVCDGKDKHDTLKRYQDFEKWTWEECFNSAVLCAHKYGKERRKQLLGVCDSCKDLFFFEDYHCTFCHKNYFISLMDFDVANHITQCKEKREELHDVALQKLEYLPPLTSRLLKAQLACVEASIPSEALEDFWSEDYRKYWGMKLQTASSTEDLLQILTILESAIKSDFLSSNYETATELLGSRDLTEYANSFSNLETIKVPPWIPKTMSAVVLRFMEFDSSISYTMHQFEDSQRDKGSRNIITIPARYTVLRNSMEDRHEEYLHRAGTGQEDDWDVSVNMRNSSGRGRSRGRGRGGIRDGRSQRSFTGSRNESVADLTATKNDKFGPLSGWKGRQRGRGGRKRGRRTVRSKKKPAKKATRITGPSAIASASPYDKTPASSHQLEWDDNGAVQVELEEENVSSSERSGFDDDNGQASGDEYDDHIVDHHYSGGFSSQSQHEMAGLDYGVGVDNVNYVDEEEEEEEEDVSGGDGDDSEDEGQVEVEEDVEEYIDGDSEEEEGNNKFTGEEEQMQNLDKDLEFSSSDYSD